MKQQAKLSKEEQDYISEKITDIAVLISKNRDEIKEKYGEEIEITLKEGKGKISIPWMCFHLNWG